MQVQVLAPEVFWTNYNPLVRHLNNPSAGILERIESEYGILDDTLRKALSQKWVEGVDFEISTEPQPCWHHCAGIYSPAIHCAEFIDVVLEALRGVSKLWCFHVACESANLGNGQIFFYQGSVYGCSYERFDYSIFDKRNVETSLPITDSRQDESIVNESVNFEMTVQDAIPIGDDEFIVFGIATGRLPTINDQLLLLKNDGKSQPVIIKELYSELGWDGRDWNLKTGVRRGLGLTNLNKVVPVPGDVLKSVMPEWTSNRPE